MIQKSTSERLPKPLLTIQEVAELCRVSHKTVRRWIKKGDLIAHRLGRQWRVSEGDLELFLRERRGLNLVSPHVHKSPYVSGR